MSVSEALAQDLAQTPIDGRGAVLKLRDELLLLVTAFNKIGCYRDAQRAQRLAVALHKFEDEVIITNMAWPPRVEKDDDGYFIPDMEGKPMNLEP